ncbi:MAG: pantoate--beta-alanine ligase [Thermoleophilaceae bacterium]|nr:pantoate--beta-alanine ligase [Thermoleophilaceae bacterium]
MRTLTTLDDLRLELDAARLSGRSIGLVPTMGALHEGHLSLVDRSVAENGVTVVTIFVNPTQFRPGEDLEAYPRQLQDDIALASERGADIVFAPPVHEIYPDGYSTTVSVVGITETLCGAPERRGHEHFDGVTTVVAKLFNMVQADRAYFGQKDAQQVAVIRRMATDLNFRTKVIACPTVREADGLALSSRNAYLTAEERPRALALSKALRSVAGALSDGQRDVATLSAIARDELSVTDSVEYFEIVDPDTLEPVSTIERPVLAVTAARVGKTRLIDNFLLEPHATAVTTPTNPNPTPQAAHLQG